jgi:hypothetical protein
VKSSFIVLLLFATFSFAQDNNPVASTDHSKQKKGFVTVEGCVSRSSGDYVLVKQNPAMTYELQATGKIRLREYLACSWPPAAGRYHRTEGRDDWPGRAYDEFKLRRLEQNGFCHLCHDLGERGQDNCKRVFATLADNVIITAGSHDQAEVR